jgi:hypothetical protein
MEVQSMAVQLRVFPAPEEFEDYETFDANPPIRIRLGDLLPLMAMAQKQHYIWLQDFIDDEVSISSDLHDVLMAFRSCRPSA